MPQARHRGDDLCARLPYRDYTLYEEFPRRRPLLWRLLEYPSHRDTWSGSDSYTMKGGAGRSDNYAVLDGVLALNDGTFDLLTGAKSSEVKLPRAGCGPSMLVGDLRVTAFGGCSHDAIAMFLRNLLWLPEFC